MEQSHDSNITLLGSTNFRQTQTPFGIRQGDRRAHMYVLGKTGVGKSTFLANVICQDILAGEGVCLLDPHGDLVSQVHQIAQDARPNDLIYFNVPDLKCALGFNPLAHIQPAKRSLAASGILEVFKNMWADSWGPRTEHLLRNCILSLMDVPFSTLADILRLLQDMAYRRQVIPYISNPQVRLFWQQEFEGYTSRLRAEAIAPIQNKVGAFLSDPQLRAILTKQNNLLQPRVIMEQGKILLVNLSKGLIGQDTSSLLGALLVSSLGVAGLTRADTPESERRDFYLYLDEFQNISTNSLVSMLSELRKYKVNLILANQYLSQLSKSVQDALLGNIGTIIAFRVGPEDADLLSKEFYPVFNSEDFMNLPNYHFYVRLMANGKILRPFSAYSPMP